MPQQVLTKRAEERAHAHAHANLGERHENPLLYLLPFLANTAVVLHLPRDTFRQDIGVFTFPTLAWLTIFFLEYISRRLEGPRANRTTHTRIYKMPQSLTDRAASSAHAYDNLAQWYENPLWHILAYAVNVVICVKLPKGTIATAIASTTLTALGLVSIYLARGVDRRLEGPKTENPEPEWDMIEDPATDSKLIDAAITELTAINLNIDGAKAVKKQLATSITEARSELKATGRNVRHVFQDADDSDWEFVKAPVAHVDTLTTVRTELETLHLHIRQVKAVHKSLAQEILEARRELRNLRNA